MPTTYKSPGVYVNEVSSGSAPIAGVGTSTAGFIGVITPVPVSPAEVNTTPEILPADPVIIGTGGSIKKTYEFEDANRRTIVTDEGTYTFSYTDKESDEAKTVAVEDFKFNPTSKKATVNFAEVIPNTASITATYQVARLTPEQSPAATNENTYLLPKDSEKDKQTYSIASGITQLCTNFTEFQKFFGGFSTDLPSGQNTLAHAVYGFFRNGGTRCYVVWIQSSGELSEALEEFETIDEIAIVAAPGLADKTSRGLLIDHCKQQNMQDRTAILDTPAETDLRNSQNIADLEIQTSDYAALYFPWIQVFDPVTKEQEPQGDGLIYVPPSGHLAGLYARVDHQRGVHKAPANEPVVGAVGLKYAISKSHQDDLNPSGLNCIRTLNGNIRVWGARTLGGDANGEFKYINVRRLFNYLRESIDEGTQWIVFEPNSPELWAAIRRNVTSFLTLVWRSGALFGATPEEAFFVQCDAETNPPDVRDAGQVVIKIGVAVVKPAEFVIFNLSQWTGPGGS